MAVGEKNILSRRPPLGSLREQIFFPISPHFLPFSSAYCEAWSQANVSPQSVSFPFTFQELFLEYSPLYALPST